VKHNEHTPLLYVAWLRCANLYSFALSSVYVPGGHKVGIYFVEIFETILKLHQHSGFLMVAKENKISNL
jgi:hypothetical protein